LTIDDVTETARTFKSKMPVPVTTTNPDGKGLVVHTHVALPTTGSLFARLGAPKMGSDADDDRRAPAMHNRTDDEEQILDSVSTSAGSKEPTILVSQLRFSYIGEDGMPLPGVLALLQSTTYFAKEHLTSLV
jgi:hypothetical protein